jgi:hypothetical protein
MQKRNSKELATPEVMGGPCGLEPQTSTVSNLNPLERRRDTEEV